MNANCPYSLTATKLNFKQARGIYWWLKHYFTDECLYSYHLSALLYDWENQTYMHVDLHYSANSKFTINWPPLSQSQWSNFVSHNDKSDQLYHSKYLS